MPTKRPNPESLPPPIPANEQLIDVEFPLYGWDVSTEFMRQRSGTTVVGTNVRAMEPEKLRLRGGSRPGLSKYLPVAMTFPAGGSTLVQHLDFIVDPTTAALLDNFDSTDADSIPDPSSGGRNPGRRVRTSSRTRRVLPRLSTVRSSSGAPKKRPNKPPGKGSGRQGNRNKPAAGGAPAFVQANSIDVVTPNASGAIAFASPVTAGNLLLVMVEVAQNSVAGVLTIGVTDTLFNSYTLIGQISAPLNLNAAALFWAIANGSGTPTVTVTQSKNPATAGVAAIGLSEYSGILTSPLDGFSTNSQANFYAPPATTGVVSVAAAGELLFGVFLTSTAEAFTPGAGLTQRLDGTLGSIFVYTMDNLAAAASAAVTATPAVGLKVLSIGASFKPGATGRTAKQRAQDTTDSYNRTIDRLEQLPNLTSAQEIEIAGLQEQIVLLQRVIEGL